jgi:hypothetical protein
MKFPKMLIVSLLCLGSLGLLSLAQGATRPTAEPRAVDADRWLEHDLYCFTKANMQKEADELFKQIAPLFAGVTGWRGIILNAGWLTDYVTEWNGDLNQPLPIPKYLSRAHISQVGLLTGTTEERIQKSRARRERYHSRTNIFYDDWTYGDFGRLVAVLRQTAARHGIDDFKVGILFVAWDRIYTGRMSQFAVRHPEAFRFGMFSNYGTYDMECRMQADQQTYAAFPNGLREGTPIAEFFGAQWGSVSKAVGLDAIHLRDGFLGGAQYRRTGPFGLTAPSDPARVASWSRATADFVKATKLGNPNAIVMGYSNSASAVADWRVNCFDLEAIAHEGYLDVWIDQSWSGANNEFGVRALWSVPFKGWTQQLAYILVHGAVLAKTKVRHYVLTEGVDSWEPGDVFRMVPLRWKWGVWAFHHAAVKTPSGLKMPRGSYIAMVQRGGELFDREEIAFMAEAHNSAIIDARQTKEVFGPTMVYSREAMVWQSHHAPDQFINEWIDEQMGNVLKWSVPCLSITRSEWLDQIRTDLPVIQTPVHLPADQVAAIAQRIESGQPVAIFGSAAGGIDPGLAALMGVRLGAAKFPAPPEMHRALLADANSPYIDDVPYRFSFLWQANDVTAIGEGKPVYAIGESTPLVVQSSAGRKTLFWDPAVQQVNPVPKNESKPLIEWIKSTYPYFLTARVLHDFLQGTTSPWLKQPVEDAPVAIHSWQLEDGSYRVLAGNMEEGLKVPHHRDYSEHIVVEVPPAWREDGKPLAMTEGWSGRSGLEVTDRFRVDLEQAESKLFKFARP